MLRDSYPYYLANRPEAPNQDLEVLDKYRGNVATRVALADEDAIDRGIAAAVRAAEPMARMAAYERQSVLMHCVDRFTERADELADALCIEAGKPIRDSRGEVGRLIDTFRVAAEESVRITGEVMPLDISPRARGYSGMWKRVPIGPCSFIAPFNFPLNLAAHKVAPALAVGCVAHTLITQLHDGQQHASVQQHPGRRLRRVGAFNGDARQRRGLCLIRGQDIDDTEGVRRHVDHRRRVPYNPDAHRSGVPCGGH